MKKLFLFIILILPFVFIGQTTSLDWVKSFGSGTGGFDNSNAITIDNYGNTIVVGTFQNVVDFDPSLNINNVVSKGASDGFIAKYDSLGTLLWIKTIQGVSDENINSVAVDSNNNILIVGNFSVTADFDPSSVVANLTSTGDKDIFLAKYDQNGNYIWSKSMGSAYADDCWSIALDLNGNIFITGNSASPADFDPSASVAIVSLSGSFLAKYDNNGDYLFAMCLAGGAGKKLFVDNTGSVYVTGWYNGTYAHFAGSQVSVPQGGASDIYVAKYTNMGSNLWYRTFSGSGTDHGDAITTDINGNVYVMGLYQGTVDFDPSPAVANQVPIGGQDMFLLKLDNLGNYVWAKTIGGPGHKWGYSMLLDSNSNNIYICGYAGSAIDFDPSPATETISTNSIAAFLANYDSNGNYNWVVGLDGGGSNATKINFGVDIKRKNNGNIVFTGSIHDTTDFDPSPAIHDLISQTSHSAFFAEYNSAGGYVNAYSTYDPSGKYAGITDIVTNPMGYIYSAGYFNGTLDFDPGMGAMTLSPDSTINDGFLLKQDTLGNIIWAADIGIGSSVTATSITTDITGNVYIAGRYINGSINSIYIAKYDTNGILIWENIIGGSNLDYARTISLDNSGRLVITGNFKGNVDFDPSVGNAYILSSGSGVNDNLFIAKYDINGNYVWARAIDTKSDKYDSKLDANNNIYIVGNYTGLAKLDPLTTNTSFTSTSGSYNGFLAKYNSSGQFLWSKSTGSASVGQSYLAIDNFNNPYLLQTYSGTLTFVSASSVTTTLSSTNVTIGLSKFDSNGNNTWARSVGGQLSIGYGICLDNYNNIFITGSYYQTANFDQSSGGSSITSAGSSDMYLAAYDSNNNFLSVKSIGGASIDESYSVFCDASNNIYIGGRYNLTVDFDPSSSSPSSIQTTLGSQNMFICKYKSCVSCQSAISVEELANHIFISMNPNPTDGPLNIKSQTELQKIEVVSITGQILMTKIEVNNNYNLSIALLPNGIYFINVYQNNHIVRSEKVVLIK